MGQWPEPCKKAMEMFRQGITLQTLINHMKNCPQCQQILPFIRDELEKSLGANKEQDSSQTS